MEIKSLATTSFDTIFEAFDRAFADYEVQQNKPQLETMLRRRGFDPGLSFAAFDGEQIVAFTLNGTGIFDGMPTAYDTGTGTLKDYRGKGLATDIFNYSIPYLQRMNIRQYLLEVLQHNVKAVSVYRNLGFEVTREFNYFVQKNQDVDHSTQISRIPVVIKDIVIEEYASSIAGFRDFSPSWQNSFESTKRTSSDFISRGAFAGDKLVGYFVFDPVSGDVAQIAVDKPYRRQGIASLLLREIVALNRNDVLKVLNTDVLCASITSFLESKNIHVAGTQFEMIKGL